MAENLSKTLNQSRAVSFILEMKQNLALKYTRIKWEDRNQFTFVITSKEPVPSRMMFPNTNLADGDFRSSCTPEEEEDIY